MSLTSKLSSYALDTQWGRYLYLNSPWGQAPKRAAQERRLFNHVEATGLDQFDREGFRCNIPKTLQMSDNSDTLSSNDGRYAITVAKNDAASDGVQIPIKKGKRLSPKAYLVAKEQLTKVVKSFPAIFIATYAQRNELRKQQQAARRARQQGFIDNAGSN